jgi:hypothetical protein
MDHLRTPQVRAAGLPPPSWWVDPPEGYWAAAGKLLELARVSAAVPRVGCKSAASHHRGTQPPTISTDERGTAMRVIERLTEAEARARRQAIVEQVGGDEAAFRERAEDYLLDAEELTLYDELNALDYLLAP